MTLGAMLISIGPETTSKGSILPIGDFIGSIPLRVLLLWRYAVWTRIRTRPDCGRSKAHDGDAI
jgi:hypothetical protein